MGLAAPQWKLLSLSAQISSCAAACTAASSAELAAAGAQGEWAQWYADEYAKCMQIQGEMVLKETYSSTTTKETGNWTFTYDNITNGSDYKIKISKDNRPTKSVTKTPTKYTKDDFKDVKTLADLTNKLKELGLITVKEGTSGADTEVVFNKKFKMGDIEPGFEKDYHAKYDDKGNMTSDQNWVKFYGQIAQSFLKESIDTVEDFNTSEITINDSLNIELIEEASSDDENSSTVEPMTDEEMIAAMKDQSVLMEYLKKGYIDIVSKNNEDNKIDWQNDKTFGDKYKETKTETDGHEIWTLDMSARDNALKQLEAEYQQHLAAASAASTAAQQAVAEADEAYKEAKALYDSVKKLIDENSKRAFSMFS